MLTYNIWNFNRDWPTRLHLLQRDIERNAPDIVTFQEVRYDFVEGQHQRIHAHQVHSLAQKLPGYQYVYHAAMTYVSSFPLHTDEGVAIFSRFPIKEWYGCFIFRSYQPLSRNFSDHDDSHQRGCLQALIETPVGLINIFTTHFALRYRRNV